MALTAVLSALRQQKQKLFIKFGAVHKRHRPLLGRKGGVKNWSKLPKDSTKKLSILGRGFQKLLTLFMDGPLLINTANLTQI